MSISFQKISFIIMISIGFGIFLENISNINLKNENILTESKIKDIKKKKLIQQLSV